MRGGASESADERTVFLGRQFHWPDEWMGRVVLVDGSWDGEDFVVEEWLKMEDGTGESIPPCMRRLVRAMDD